MPMVGHAPVNTHFQRLKTALKELPPPAAAFDRKNAKKKINCAA